MTPEPADPNDVAPAVANLDTIVSLSKRRGFIFPSSEIYGGINAVWDYGPLGVELKNNVKRAWWRAMVQDRNDIVGLDAGILMHPQVWITSGHVGSFSDPLVECPECHRRFRLDELPGAEDLSATDLRDETITARLGLVCPNDGKPLSPPRRFNLMFTSHMGPVEDEAAIVYFRPETAQGSYVNFKNVQQSSRKKIPFGIAQIGKSFRNEISPGNFVFRMREFEQMEMQYFVRPDDGAADAFEFWLPKRHGLVPGLRRRPVPPPLPGARPGRAGALRQEGDRRRVPLPVRLEGARGHPQPRRLRPRLARQGLRREPRVLRPGSGRALHPVGRRDGGRRGPGGVHVPDRRLSRGGGPRRDARGPRAAPGPGAVQGRRPAAAQEASGDRGACATGSWATSSAT